MTINQIFFSMQKMDKYVPGCQEKLFANCVFLIK